MSKAARLLLMLVVLPLLLLMTPERAAASCRCSPEDPATALYNSDVVFLGKVVDTLFVGGMHYLDEDIPSIGNRQVTLQVSKVWKGSVGDTVNVLTEDLAYSSPYTSCGYPFNPDTEYIVYASYSQGQLWTYLCSGTTMLQGAEEDLKVLNAGPDLFAWVPEEVMDSWPYLLADVLALGLLVVLLVLRKRIAE